jgi:hypothetical protein
MKANPILEELWKIKDDLAREAGYDAHRFMENLRRWEAEHPQPGRVIRTAEELRQYAEEEEHRRATESVTALNDKPPRKP